MSGKFREDAVKLKAGFIITLCDAIAGGKKGLENDEKGIIDKCVRKIYAEYFSKEGGEHGDQYGIAQEED